MISLSPIGSWLCVKRLPAPETRGSFEVPEEARETYFDSLIIAAPQDSAFRPLDRVLFPPDAIRGELTLKEAIENAWVDSLWLKPGGDGEDEGVGFVKAEHLIGRIPSPDYSRIEPAGKYVLLHPRHKGREEAQGPLLKANRSLPGAESRLRQRGYELFQEYQALIKSERYLREPEGKDYRNGYLSPDRERVLHDFLDHMTQDERTALIEVAKEQARDMGAPGGLDGWRGGQEGRYEALPPFRPTERPHVGELLGVGPAVPEPLFQQLAAEGFPKRAPVVHWQQHHRGVNLLDGRDRRFLLLLHYAYLDAVEPAPIEATTKLIVPPLARVN